MCEIFGFPPLIHSLALLHLVHHLLIMSDSKLANLYLIYDSRVFQIRALEKKQKAGKYAKKVKAKTRRKMHELSNPLEQDEFADIWKD